MNNLVKPVCSWISDINSNLQLKLLLYDVSLKRFLSRPFSVFLATLFFFRPVFLFLFQSHDVGQGEVWLVLTDPSLQVERPEKPCKRTVALCVSTSCVLTSSVLTALNSPAACRMSFRDAIRERGTTLFWRAIQTAALTRSALPAQQQTADRHS